jgi:uncharacterized repeat protein (TIGR03806 family)
MKFRVAFALLTVFSVLAFACKKEEEEPEPDVPVVPDTAVNVDLAAMPFENLSEYRFFVNALKDLEPNARVIPYDVITPLFSDYAKKKKFIWMPEGTSASYNGDHELLQFPDGTVMIKNFYYDQVQPQNARKIIETRLLYKKDGEWLFAEYVWNDAQTEATLLMDGAYQDIEWMNESNELQSVNYRIPSEVECFTCHKKNDIASPIGPKPQNINRDYPYSDGVRNQLEKWQEVGYLDNSIPAEINTVADWTDVNLPIRDRVRAYVDMNCAHCHREGSHCDYRPIRLAWSETEDDANLGICVDPQEFINPQLTKIINRGIPNRSVMLFRMNTTVTQYRMPLLGRTVIHQEAVDLFTEFIDSLEPACP